MQHSNEELLHMFSDVIDDSYQCDSCILKALSVLIADRLSESEAELGMLASKLRTAIEIVVGMPSELYGISGAEDKEKLFELLTSAHRGISEKE